MPRHSVRNSISKPFLPIRRALAINKRDRGISSDSPSILLARALLESALAHPSEYTLSIKSSSEETDERLSGEDVTTSSLRPRSKSLSVVPSSSSSTLKSCGSAAPPSSDASIHPESSTSAAHLQPQAANCNAKKGRLRARATSLLVASPTKPKQQRKTLPAVTEEEDPILLGCTAYCSPSLKTPSGQDLPSSPILHITRPPLPPTAKTRHNCKDTPPAYDPKPAEHMHTLAHEEDEWEIVATAQPVAESKQSRLNRRHKSNISISQFLFPATTKDMGNSSSSSSPSSAEQTEQNDETPQLSRRKRVSTSFRLNRLVVPNDSSAHDDSHRLSSRLRRASANDASSSMSASRRLSITGTGTMDSPILHVYISGDLHSWSTKLHRRLSTYKLPVSRKDGNNSIDNVDDVFAADDSGYQSANTTIDEDYEETRNREDAENGLPRLPTMRVIPTMNTLRRRFSCPDALSQSASSASLAQTTLSSPKKAGLSHCLNSSSKVYIPEASTITAGATSPLIVIQAATPIAPRTRHREAAIVQQQPYMSVRRKSLVTDLRQQFQHHDKSEGSPSPMNKPEMQSSDSQAESYYMTARTHFSTLRPSPAELFGGLIFNEPSARGLAGRQSIATFTYDKATPDVRGALQLRPRDLNTDLAVKPWMVVMPRFVLDDLEVGLRDWDRDSHALGTGNAVPRRRSVSAYANLVQRAA